MLPCILYVLLPNVALMTLHLDQVVYPILFLLLPGLLVLSYNPVERFRNAMEQHQSFKGWEGGIGPTLYWAGSNWLEFAFWIGCTVALLYLVHLQRAARDTVRNRASPVDTFGVAVNCTLPLLGLFGRTQGEVARLWLFLGGAADPGYFNNATIGVGSWIRDRRDTAGSSNALIKHIGNVCHSFPDTLVPARQTHAIDMPTYAKRVNTTMRRSVPLCARRVPRKPAGTPFVSRS